MADILVIEDETILAKNICDSLKMAGHTVAMAGSGEDGLRCVAADRPDLILTDYRLPGIDGLEVLRKLRAEGCLAAVILMTAHGEVETAVEAMKAGAADFLIKPLDLMELQLVVERALRQRQTTEELAYRRDRERAASGCDAIIGDCDAIQRVRAFVLRIAGTAALSAPDPPLLITGETGTGKDLVARAVHYAGSRRGAEFVHVNCTAIPDHLAESEFFGHVKGAFTDARKDKRGLFELAEGGTLFLDEIGHMSVGLQAKLLHVLEHRTIRSLGSTKERKVNVHVIAATNRNIAEAIESRELREDLYHRLRVLTIEMPPLRSRGGDIEKLANFFLKRCAARYRVLIDGFGPRALETIRSYDWPGNVRELMHTIESAVLIADGPTIRREHLNVKCAEPTGLLEVELESVRGTIKLDFRDGCPKLDEIENEIILAALAHSNHNVSRASRILGISRDAIRYRLEKFAKCSGPQPD